MDILNFCQRCNCNIETFNCISGRHKFCIFCYEKMQNLCPLCNDDLFSAEGEYTFGDRLVEISIIKNIKTMIWYLPRIVITDKYIKTELGWRYLGVEDWPEDGSSKC